MTDKGDNDDSTLEGEEVYIDEIDIFSKIWKEHIAKMESFKQRICDIYFFCLLYFVIIMNGHNQACI